MKVWQSALMAAAIISPFANGLSLTVDDSASIRSAAGAAAQGLMELYVNNATGTAEYLIGTFAKPIYWWEAGAVWGGMIDYWAYTGDASYVDTTAQALLAQAGPDNDFMNEEWEKELGNDDQVFWGLAAMSAVETGFASENSTEWLALAVNTFNSQVARWDTSTCDGGLKWQIYTFNNGYDYKNSISNGGLFQLAARLARYTGNQTYVDWAEKVFNWCEDVGFVDSSYNVFDGASDTDNCTDASSTIQWSYNVAMFLHGAATLYNHTDGNSTWEERTTGLLKATGTFFGPHTNTSDVMYEQACEPYDTCDTDQLSFKAYLARWMAKTSVLAPYTKDSITPLLQASAEGAAAACSGGTDGQTCGYRWDIAGYDENSGVGQQLAAMEVIQALLIGEASAPAVLGSGSATSTATSSASSSTESTAVAVETAVSSSAVSSTAISAASTTSGSVDMASVVAKMLPWIAAALATGSQATATSSAS